MLEEGSCFTRREIHDLFGGAIEGYLPSFKGRVTCICLREDLNPGAPTVLLIGTGPKVMTLGDLLCKQNESLPLFMKNNIGSWRYFGNYRVKNSTTDEKSLTLWKTMAGRVVTKVVNLEKVES